MLALLLAMTLTGFDPSVLTVPIAPYVEPVHIETPKEIATRIATEHHLKVDRFLKTIECESGWNTHAVGDNGTSFGLAQLHNPKRDWGVTIEQAYVPEIALTLMAKSWNKGEAWRWSCWKAIYGD